MKVGLKLETWVEDKVGGGGGNIMEEVSGDMSGSRVGIRKAIAPVNMNEHKLFTTVDQKSLDKIDPNSTLPFSCNYY